MTTYLRSLFEGSSSLRNGKRSHPNTMPSSSAPSGFGSKRNKSRPASYSSFPLLDHSHPSLLENTKKHHHHHHHDPRTHHFLSMTNEIADSLIIATPYPILLHTASQHSHSSSTDSLTPTSSHQPTPSAAAHSEPRPVLKKRSTWQSKPHTGPQRTSFLRIQIIDFR